MIEQEKIKAAIDQEFELSEAIAALEYVEKGKTKGEVIINVTR